MTWGITPLAGLERRNPESADPGDQRRAGLGDARANGSRRCALLCLVIGLVGRAVDVGGRPAKKLRSSATSYLVGNLLILARLLRLVVLQRLLQGTARAVRRGRDPDLQLHHRLAGQPAAAGVGRAVRFRRARRSRSRRLAGLRFLAVFMYGVVDAVVLLRARAPAGDRGLGVAVPGARLRRAVRRNAAGRER